MKKLFEVTTLDLQLFAEGAAGASGGGEGGAAAGVSAADAGQNNTGVQNGAANAGTAAADAGQVNASEDPAKAFEKLIKGQYKDQYNAKVKDTVDKRLRNIHQQLQSYEAGQPLFDILAQKYGKESTDYAGIAEAVKNDSSFFEKEALERGMDVQDYMQLQKVQLENASMRRQMEKQNQLKEEMLRRQQVDEQVAKWNQQAEQAKQVYPGLDLDAELANPAFRQLLNSNVPVQAAYQVVHLDEIMQGAMQYAAQRAAKGVSDTVMAGAARPAENGTGSKGAVTTKLDPSKFTEAQMLDIRRRVENGEIISF